MDDIVLFVCGGGAYRTFDNANGRISIPTVILKSDEDLKTSTLFRVMNTSGEEQSVSMPSVDDHMPRVRSLIEGKRIVMIYSSLGGGTVSEAIPLVTSCAHDCGCKVVSIVGIPMVFEKDHRAAALRALPEIAASSDRLFIMDMQSINMLYYSQINFRSSLEVYSRMVAFTINNLHMLMNGPFFSTFSQRVYTFAYVSEMDPVEAVTRAMDMPLVETNPLIGKLILFVSSGFGTAESEAITDKITSMSGILPEIIKREDFEDTKVLMFLTVKGFDH